MPTPFYEHTKVLNSDWITALGPCAKYFSAINKTVVVWYMVGDSGEKGVQVAAYDHATQSWSERYKVGTFTGLVNDDHGQPAIVQDADGYFYVFYGSHDSWQRWSVSNVPNDISGWTQQASITGEQTYPRPVLVGSTIYLILRDDTTATGTPGSGWALKLAVRTATPSGGNASFSGFTQLVTFGPDTRVYGCIPQVVGTEIHVMCTRANAIDNARRDVYYFVYDTVTGAVKNHDSSFSVAPSSLPVNLSTANANYRLYTHTSPSKGDIPSLCFDSNGDPHALFLDNNGTGDANTYNLLHITKTAGVWGATTTVDSIQAHLPNIGYVNTYTCVPGAAGEIEAWYANPAGDKVRAIRNSVGVWGTPTVIQASLGDRLLGNQAVADAQPDFRTIYCDVAISKLDVDAIACHRFGHGDAGPIGAAIPMTPDDTLYPSVSALFGFDHRDNTQSAIDESDKCVIATFSGNAKIDTAVSRFAGGSLYLDGNGDYLTLKDNPLFKVTQGDFCIEMHIRRNSTKLQSLFNKRPATGVSEYASYIDANNCLVFQGYSTATNVLNIIGTTPLASTTDWYECTFSRVGNVWSIYLDGVLDAQGTQSAAPSTNNKLLYIGRDPSNTSRDFRGWIDEFRYTSGNGRYTANFAPHTAKFPRR